ncbi:ketopantoate reductase family protein [Sphingomonas oleivorans]|uniref:ketopantoate reductase family protein n=1 Tax=Sphingomonas oleivorans TaxID=1735121 RepID=UPI0013FD5CC1|nr:2-dehydropantoate 2-reductase [Sphingomonas oleivorans]
MTSRRPRRICVAGVGAIGGAITGLLMEAGHAVHVVARGARRAQLAATGLAVRSGTRTIHARPLLGEPADLGVQDVLFVAVKAQALPEFLPRLMPMIGPGTIVVPAVNGLPWWYFQKEGGRFDGSSVETVDPGGVLMRLLPAGNIAGCVVYITAQMQADGAVDIIGAPRLILGRPDGQRDLVIADLAATLSDAGIGTSISTAIRADLWTKMALNLATNPLSVMSGATLHALFHRPDLLESVRAVLREAEALAGLYGVRPSMSLDAMVERGRAAGPFETSMLQDFRRGAPLELGAIADALFALADRMGFAMPAARAIVGQARGLATAR